MTTVKYHTTSRDRVCRICLEPIARHTWAIVFDSVHVPGMRISLHFHEGCLVRAMETAKETAPWHGTKEQP
jgi:hypothetical protein